MSWETLVVGYIDLKNATDEDLILIQDYLEFGREVEKVDIKVENGITKIEFVSVNWLSHIDEQRIDELIKKLKKKLKHYAISLFYLDGEYAQNWFSD